MSDPLDNSRDRYAVIGNPVEHSKSPDIHRLFADQTGENISYEKILADDYNFFEVVTDFFNSGGKGLNVTVPFKNLAFEFVDEHSEFAKHASAVNTIYQLPGGRYFGANTDGIGLLRDLKKTLRLQLQNKKILIIGAGGATQGIVEPLLVESPAELIIANRTVNKAESIAKQLEEFGAITSSGLQEIPIKIYDLILHTTSAGLHGHTLNLPENIISNNTCCYDLLYSDTDTPFMLWAKQQGATQVVDGFGMLLEQAAESFYLWRGQRPDTRMAYSYFRPVKIQ